MALRVRVHGAKSSSQYEGILMTLKITQKLTAKIC